MILNNSIFTGVIDMDISCTEIGDTGSGTGSVEWREQRVGATQYKLAILEKGGTYQFHMLEMSL